MTQTFPSPSSSFEDSPIPPSPGLGMEDSASSPAFSDILDDLELSKSATPRSEHSLVDYTNHVSRVLQQHNEYTSSNNSGSAISTVSDSPQPQAASLESDLHMEYLNTHVAAMAAEATDMINSSNSGRTPQNYQFIHQEATARTRRPRRKHDEVNRVYKCNFGSCDKGYGHLTHLNGHVKAKGHGPKRNASEFKELRSQLNPGRRRGDGSRRRGVARRVVESHILPSNGPLTDDGVSSVPNVQPFVPTAVRSSSLPIPHFATEEEPIFHTNGNGILDPYTSFANGHRHGNAFARQHLSAESSPPLNDPLFGALGEPE